MIDNEGMGKKKSKVCCIYYKPHESGDSDGESDDSSSGSDSDNEPDLSRARRAGGSERRHRHDREQGLENAGGDTAGSSAAGKGKERKASPNAYERQPKPKARKDG